MTDRFPADPADRFTAAWFAADGPADRTLPWFAADGLLAVAFGFLTWVQVTRPSNLAAAGPVEGFGWVLVLGPLALIAVRRLAPVTVLAAAIGLFLLSAIEHGEGNAFLAIPPLAYMVAATRPVLVSAAISALGVVVLSTTTLYGPGQIDEFDGGVPLVLFGFFAIGWGLGASVRAGRLRQRELAVQATITQAEIDAAAEQAVADERARIARELHDAVGHAVNVMVMQAGAARLATDDERSRGALQSIEKVGRAALSDLDRMLGLLHGADPDGAPTEPTHGLADIARLVEGVRAAGADVHLDDRCSHVLDTTVERPIGVAAYRIVQEGLTNAVKHAGPARIEVTLACDDDEVVISVIDDGRGAAVVPSGGGRGIVGMAERAEIHGGRLVAGPRAGGGFAVEAHLPRGGER